MFPCRILPAVILGTFLVLGTPRTMLAAGTDAARAPDVQQLLKQLKSTLIKVQGEIAAKRLPELKSVQITLQTGIKEVGGGKITFFVVSLGDTLTSDRIQTLKMTLIPPKVSSAQVSELKDFSEELANAIIAVSETIGASSAEGPELNLSSLSASVKFVSESKMEGGVLKVQLLPVSFDLSGNITPTNTHEAVLNFGATGIAKPQ
jgi:hypothetical protein